MGGWGVKIQPIINKSAYFTESCGVHFDMNKPPNLTGLASAITVEVPNPCIIKKSAATSFSQFFWDPFNSNGLTLITAWIINYIHYKVWMELLIHSQTSTVQLLKFGNE